MERRRSNRLSRRRSRRYRGGTTPMPSHSSLLDGSSAATAAQVGGADYRRQRQSRRRSASRRRSLSRRSR